MLKFNKWLSTLLRNKENLEEIAITTVNAECSAIILNKVPEKLKDPGKFIFPCALQELDRNNNALADSEASINLLPHSIYKQLALSGITTTHSDALPPSSSSMKTSDNLEKFADELTFLDSLPP
ncbi:hypothetical protein Tco_0055062, partial [Tanacetum coccineum]